MSKLLFNEESHIYTMGGVQLPSVTSIIGKVGLQGESKQWYTKSATNRGTQVHNMLEFYDEEALDESNLDPQLVPYLDGWKKFLDEVQPRFIDIEKPIHHPTLNYAGKIDRFGLIGGEPYIIEIKTGQQAKWHPIQTAAYKEPYRLNSTDPGKRIKRVAVYLTNKAKYKLVPHEKDTDDFTVFVNALRIYRWIETNLGGKK